MPAVISAIFSAIYAALAKKDDYKSTLEEIFPAMGDGKQLESGTNATEIILGVSLFKLSIFFLLSFLWFITILMVFDLCIS